MDHTADRLQPAGRGTARWFLFLVFYHLLPVPWFMFVAAGLAPGSFLLALSVAGLFNADFDSLTMAGLFLVPALVSGLVFVLLSYLLVAGIGRLNKPAARILCLIFIFVVCIGVGLNPVYISGGHGPSYQFSLLDFIDILGQWRVPAAVSISYFICLALLLAGLLLYQYRPQVFPDIPLSREVRRRLLRRSMLGALILFIALFCWTHRLLFFVKPLADLGFSGAQYRLGLALQKDSAKPYRIGASSRNYFEKAAEQGHVKAAMALARSPRNAEDKLRWLTAATEGGLAEAQYGLYRFMLKSDVTDYKSRNSMDWLRSAAEKGFAGAQYELGRILIHGDQKRGIKKNSTAARHWWEKAAGRNHGRAMEELAWRYTRAADGFPRDPDRAVELLNKIAVGYSQGRYGLPQNQRLAAVRQNKAAELKALEERADRGDPAALVTIGRQLLRSPEASKQGIILFEKAASRGDPLILHELGAIFMFGRYGIEKNFKQGRNWWDLALAQNHIKTMEYVAPAYQNGGYGYRVDLLKSKNLVELLVEAYRDGRYGVDPDARKQDYWTNELKHLNRLIVLAGGSYLPPDDLLRQATSGDSRAQYQLGRQMLVAGPAAERQKGLDWIKRSAEAGYAEAQYRLVTFYENQAHIMRDDPTRGVALLQSAAKQSHLRAMGTLALAYEKGRYGLVRDIKQARDWYHELLQTYDSGRYIGEADDRFIEFNRRRLEYVNKALQYKENRSRRYEKVKSMAGTKSR